VQTRHDENYCTAYTTSEKRAVAEQILKHIKNLDPPGRFLKRIGRAPTSRGLQGPWEELSDKECIKKTCQALRDCNRTDRSGYAAAVKMPEDVRRHAESRSMTGLSNKEQAAAAAAAKMRMEGGPAVGISGHPQQQHHLPVPPPGSIPMPYHHGMRVPLPMHHQMPPPPMGGGAMQVHPDINTTSSRGYVPPPGTMPLPPPPPSHHHLHPPHHFPMHHHHPHAAHHHSHRPPPSPGDHNTNRHSPPTHPSHHDHAPPHAHSHDSSSPRTLQSHEPAPGPSHHVPPHASQLHRRTSQSSEGSSKRSRSSYDDDETVSPPGENAPDWSKKPKAIDTRAPTPSEANKITPTDPVGQGFHNDGMTTYDIGGPTRTPSHETSTTTGTTPTSEGALSRATRPSLSPPSAMPPSPSLAYNPHHAGPGNPTLYAHHHHQHHHHPGYMVPPTPIEEDHPYAFHHYHDPSGASQADPKHAYAYNGSAAFVNLDQQQLQAAAEAAAAAFPAADTHNAGDFATSSPGSYNNEDSLSLM
jgi:hypothetical protein